MSISEKAVSLHGEGNNCAQSIMCACKDITGIDEKTASAISSGFGGGLKSGEICGCISGAVMVIGKVLADKGQDDKTAALTKQLIADFRDEYGVIRCLDLKRSGHPCDELIAFASDWLEKTINNL